MVLLLYIQTHYLIIDIKMYSVGLNIIIIIFYSFYVLLMLVYCWASVADGGPAINQRLLLELCHVVRRQRHWTNVGTMLAASESDIETSNAITVWLPQCQCQSSASSTQPALAQCRHWRAHTSSNEQVTTTRYHSPMCHRVGEWVTIIHKPCHAFTWTLINTRLITFTNKQKLTKRQENKHTLKYTIHKPAKQQDKITDRIQTPQRILEGFRALGGSEKRQIQNNQIC